MALTPRQQRFVDEYLVDLNATQAAIRAGYSPRNADVTGPRLLGNVGVSEAIADAQAARAERLHMTQDEVLEEIRLLARSNVTDYSLDDEGCLQSSAGPAACRAVSAIKLKTHTDTDGNVTREAEIKLWSKPDVLRLAAQHLGMLVERHEIQGTLTHALDNLTDAELDARIALAEAAEAATQSQP